MKTRFTIITILILMALRGQAQIKKDISKSIQLTNELQLPVLKANHLDKYGEKSLKEVLSKTPPKTKISLPPKPYSSGSSGLNITLTPNKLNEGYKAGVYFRGAMVRNSIKVEGDEESSFLGIFFKAKRNKTYHIKLSFKMEHQTYACSDLKLNIHTRGNSQEMAIKEGINELEFLIQSDGDHTIGIPLLRKRRITCKGKLYTRSDFFLQFRHVKIQEL